MNYKEIIELGKKQLSDLFEIGEYTEQTKKRMLMAFAEGFVQGELRQINKRVKEIQEA